MVKELEILRAKLLAAARQAQPADTVPYDFGQRVLRYLRPAPLPDPWTQWGNALLRAASACALMALLLGAATLWRTQERETATLEDTVFAAAEELTETW
jgi:hypothetical protein